MFSPQDDVSDIATSTLYVKWVVNYMEANFLIGFADSSVRVGMDKLFLDLPFDGYLPVQVTLPKDHVNRIHYVYHWAVQAMRDFGKNVLQILKINIVESNVTIHIGNFTAISPYAKTEMQLALEWNGNPTNQLVVKEVNASMFGPTLQTCLETILKTDVITQVQIFLDTDLSDEFVTAIEANQSRWVAIDDEKLVSLETNEATISAYNIPEEVATCKVTFEYYSGYYNQDIHRLGSEKIEIIFDRLFCPKNKSDYEKFFRKLFADSFKVTQVTTNTAGTTVVKLGEQANGLQVVPNPTGQDMLFSDGAKGEIRKFICELIQNFVIVHYSTKLAFNESGWDQIYATDYKTIFKRAEKLFNDTENKPSFENFLVQSTSV